MDPTGSYTETTPTAPLHEGERLLQEIFPDPATYWRVNAWLAVIAMAAGMGILWAVGNPHAWTGAVGGLLAIGVRALYLSSDELRQRWDLTDQRLLGPNGRIIALETIAEVRSLWFMVQVVTAAGDKHLIRNLADPAAVIASIDAARGALNSADHRARGEK